jgi:integrase
VLRVIEKQQVRGQNPYVFPSATTDGPFTVVNASLDRLCAMAKIEGVTPRTLRHTFTGVASDLGFSRWMIAAMLGSGPQSIAAGDVRIKRALKIAAAKTSDLIAAILRRGEERVAGQGSSSRWSIEDTRHRG